MGVINGLIFNSLLIRVNKVSVAFVVSLLLWLIHLDLWLLSLLLLNAILSLIAVYRVLAQDVGLV